jgi:hypothetical protein
MEFSFYQHEIRKSTGMDNGQQLFRTKAILPQQAFDSRRGGPEKVRQPGVGRTIEDCLGGEGWKCWPTLLSSIESMTRRAAALY